MMLNKAICSAGSFGNVWIHFWLSQLEWGMLLVFSGQRSRHGAKHPTMQKTVIPLHPMSTVPRLRNPSSNRSCRIILAHTILVIMYLWIYFFYTDIIKHFWQNSYSVRAVFEIVFSLGQQIISFSSYI